MSAVIPITKKTDLDALDIGTHVELVGTFLAANSAIETTPTNFSISPSCHLELEKEVVTVLLTATPHYGACLDVEKAGKPVMPGHRIGLRATIEEVSEREETRRVIRGDVRSIRSVGEED